MSPDKMSPDPTTPGPLGESPFDTVVEALTRALDEMGASASDTPSELVRQVDAELEAWINATLPRDTLRGVALSKGALDLLAALMPDASLTAECITRVEARRKAVRQQIDAARQLTKRCDADSPGSLFHALRARLGIDPEPAATALGLTPQALLAIETKRAPWYQIEPSRLPQFSVLVRESLSDLVLLLRITARRLLIYEVKQRANLALGRFDKVQEPSEARRTRLKLVFARMQEQNRAAGAFLCEAERLVARDHECRAPYDTRHVTGRNDSE